jgi:hypothetical protein
MRRTRNAYASVLTVIVSAILFAGCQSAMSTSPTTPDARNATNRAPVEWPLRFSSHTFGVRCHDTRGCKVIYAGFEHGDDDDPTPSSASYGPDYLKGWNGIHGMIRNFPGPAKATWRSKDGVAHEAEIDIGEIFKDELILHNVPREEMADLPDGKYDDDPSILLEVNDRTIRVYMSARISLKKEVEIAGHMRNDWRDDVVLVKTYTY